MTRVLDALEGKGLIFRRRSVADRRIVQVTV
ncbi:MAG TPA: MarR family transcriptional regulator [Candidatus Sphingomonas excrementigallinarum]|nr:MarR family transcriptional regulator [Candidatus Sphingomonas excrementigallinarum]